jgi:hypothetical protein
MIIIFNFKKEKMKSKNLSEPIGKTDLPFDHKAKQNHTWNPVLDHL